MDRFIARENIKHFRFLIEQATDAAEKESLLKMLAKEEAKLRAAEARHRADAKKEVNRPPASATRSRPQSKQD